MKLDSDSDAWELEDAEKRYRNAPDYYPIPDLAARQTLQAGNRVMLLFLFRGRDEHGLFIQNENLVVTIREVSGGDYFGTMDTAPASSALLQAGDLIRFEARHIASICGPDVTPLPMPIHQLSISDLIGP